MLQAHLEIFPHGNLANRQSIATIQIINDGTGTADTGNYKVNVITKDKVISGFFDNYPRKDKEAVELLSRAIARVMELKDFPNKTDHIKLVK